MTQPEQLTLFEDTPPFTVAVDWDGTLAPHSWPEFPTRLMDGAFVRLHEYRDAGFKVVVYTCRTSPAYNDAVQQVQMIRKLLDEHGLDWVGISTNGKPIANVYIDDRAVRFKSWTGWESGMLSPTVLHYMFSAVPVGFNESASKLVSNA